jgi:hypothetical protein
MIYALYGLTGYRIIEMKARICKICFLFSFLFNFDNITCIFCNISEWIQSIPLKRFWLKWFISQFLQQNIIFILHGKLNICIIYNQLSVLYVELLVDILGIDIFTSSSAVPFQGLFLGNKWLFFIIF